VTVPDRSIPAQPVRAHSGTEGGKQVRFAYGIPLSYPLDPEIARALPELAARAESAGFDAVFVTEHPIPSQRWREHGGHDALDPFVALAAMAYSTESIRLLTNLTVIPYRNPFLLAKASATLDIVSNGRLILGAGVGYLKAEYAALGIDFATRNQRFDEYLRVLKQAWRGEVIDVEGQFLSAHGVVAHPPPTQQPHPPIWLGGNSMLTRRRVAEHAQGWMPMPAPRGGSGLPLETPEDLTVLLDELWSYAESVGRTDPIEVAAVLTGPLAGVSGEALTERVGGLAEVGATWLAVNGEGSTVDAALEFIDQFGSRVIAGS
jgi:probable F420-dependent oxidoreductase